MLMTFTHCLHFLHVSVVFLPIQELFVAASDALDGLELTYKVDWPLNIVISDACVTVYGRLFSFMLLLKRAVWSLKDVWTRLKRDGKSQISQFFFEYEPCR